MSKSIFGSLLVGVLVLISNTASTQTLMTSTSITTAGADCSVSTRCAGFELQPNQRIPSISIYLNVGTSGTFNWEASIDAISLITGTWVSVVDDISAAANGTADGLFVFSNPGYRFFRVRASAISGAATTTAFAGYANLRSTATLSGSSQGDGAIQDGTLNTIEATVFDATNSNPIAVSLVNATTGDAITSLGGGGVTDADDASIAVAQTTEISLGLNQVYDGTVWRRQTVGTAGTAAAQVTTIQGVASMTPVLVTASAGTNLNTSALLTSTDYAAAFGTAGVSDTQVISVQGIASGTVLGVSLAAETTKVIGVVRISDGAGNLLASNANAGTRAIAAVIYDGSGNAITAFSGSGGTASNFTSAFPSSGTAAGFSDGTNMQGARVVDADTGAGTIYTLTTNNVFRASGTPVEAGTATNPWRIDTTGTTTQPISAASLPLPTGASTEATLGTLSTTASGILTTTAFNAALGTAGTADTQVMSVQGIASMTPLSVTSNGANISTETTLAAVLTSTNYAAAFGTAGVSDTQVMSVQGIASMTPFQVQSNAANIATQTTVAAVQTAVELIDNAISGAGFNITQLGGATVPMTTTQADNLATTLDSLNTSSFMYVYDGTTFDMLRGTAADGVLVNLGANNDVDTELPAAGALSDAMANPTTPMIAAALMGWNGTTWDRLQPAIDYAIGSTTSGQKGPLIQCATTTSSPTYISGQTNPCSSDTAGSIRVAVVSGSTGNGASSNTGSAVPTQAGYTGINIGGILRGITGVNYTGTSYAGDLNIAAVGGAVAAVNNGTSDAGTARVTIASNSTGILAGVTTVTTVTGITNWNGVAIPMTTTQADNLADTLDGLNTTGLTYYYDGAAWDRWTGAITGTVTANAGTNLNTSTLLTTTDYNAALGTAGTADTQVRTVQGIASMTPLQVQSNAASIATETTLASALTALQLIDNSQTGDSIHYRTSAGATEDEHEVKATAGVLNSVAFTNTNAAARYWRCSNLTATNTTPGTSTVLLGLAIPGNTAGAGFTHVFGPNGAAFGTALTCWFVTGAADTDVAEVAANEIKATYTFK